MLDSNGKTNSVGLNALIGKFIFAELAMRGGRRMNDKALGIGNIRKQREDFKVVDKLMRLRLTALDFKCKYRTAAVRELSLI